MERAVVDEFALGSAESGRAGASVVVQRAQHASAAVLARVGVARVRHEDLAQRSRIAQRTRTGETGHGVG